MKDKLPLDSVHASRTRIGALALPISGLVAASAALVPGIGINPAVDPAGFAQAANYVGLANLVGIVSLVFLLFGFQALHAFLERNSVDKWAFAGMIFSVIGLGLLTKLALGIFVPLAVLVIGWRSARRVYETLLLLGITALVVLPWLVHQVTTYGWTDPLAMTRHAQVVHDQKRFQGLSAPLNWIPHYIPAFWFLGGILLFGAGIAIARGIWTNS